MSPPSHPHAPKRIIQPGHNVWKVARADDAGVIIDAANYYHAFYEAAANAKKTILLSGWQFDSGVQILRGDDAPAGAEVRLLKFLNQLCAQKPELEIYILAWDFHVVFALEREWMQNLYFQWGTNERLHFRFDGAQVAQGAHHQKFAVIDRAVSFLGGMDICEARWDDRQHHQHNPLRISHGDPVKPYHDVQAFFTGCEVADVLRQLFLDRWSRSKGSPMQLAECAPPAAESYAPRGALAIGRGNQVAFSRTDPRGPDDTIREVEALFADAIAAAEQSIYIETQYFSSRSVCQALTTRMQQRDRPGLEIVVVLNQKPEALKEEIAIGLRQAKILTRVSQTAAETGHALGIYDTWAETGGMGDVPSDGEIRLSTYIHSKLLIVDDRYLTVGSANLTNRSMGVDTELHVSWEAAADSDSAADDDRRLVAEIAGLRVSLLAEHAGMLADGEPTENARRLLGSTKGLVARLDELTRAPNARLQVHVIADDRDKQVMSIVDAEALPFDPENPDYDDDADDAAAHAEEHAHTSPLFVGGLTALWDKLKPTSRR